MEEKQFKAKKLYSIYGKYSDIVVYEYRGREYEVEYAKDNSYCCSSPWVQHRNEQSKIDEVLDNPKPNSGESFDFDEVWKMLGWD